MIHELPLDVSSPEDSLEQRVVRIIHIVVSVLDRLILGTLAGLLSPS